MWAYQISQNWTILMSNLFNNGSEILKRCCREIRPNFKFVKSYLPGSKCQCNKNPIDRQDCVDLELGRGV